MSSATATFVYNNLQMPLIPTVMPEENKPHENLGAPGIHIPDNARDISAFSEVSNVDAKELNAKLQAQDEAKAQSTPGIHLPSNAKDIKEFGEVRNEDPKALNAKLEK